MDKNNDHSDLKSAADDPSMLTRLLSVLRRHPGNVALGVLAGIALAIVYCLATPVFYKSDVRILVIAKDTKLPTQGTESNSPTQSNEDSVEALLATHMELLTSPRVVQQALEQNNLDKLPSILNRLGFQETPADYVIKHLSVERGGKGAAKQAHMLRVTFKHTSPKETADILTAVVESYKTFLGQTFESAGQQAANLISHAKAELEADLHKQESAYAEFRKNSPLLWQGEQAMNIHQTRLAEIEHSLFDLRSRITTAQSRLAILEKAVKEGKLNSISDLGQLSLVDDRDIQRLQLLLSVDRGEPLSEKFQAGQPARTEAANAEYNRLVALRSEERNQLADLGVNHPSVQRTRQNIKMLEEFLAQQKAANDLEPNKIARITPAELMKAYSNLLEHDITDWTTREAELVEKSKQEEAAAKTLVVFELEDQTIRKDLERKQELYNAVVARLREINFVKDYGGYVTEIVSPIELGKKSWPKLSVCLMLGALAGLVIGSGAAATIDYVDRSFHSPAEVARELELPLLACINEFDDSLGLADAASPIDASVLAVHQPHSQEAEAMRGLRTSLYFSSPDKPLQVVQLTSPLAGDGKSVLSANLAVSIAQSGKRVLLMDADLRHQRIAKLFGVSSDCGLSRVVAGNEELPDAVQSTAVPNLFVLTSGPTPPNPAELLASARFGQLVDVVRQQYDFVVIDSPPVLAVNDPLAIAPHADGVVLAVRMTKNSRPAAERCCEMLQKNGIRVLGVIVNGLPRHPSSAEFLYSGYGALAADEIQASGELVRT